MADQNNRPRRRETNVTDNGVGVHRRDDEGLGTGKVGTGSAAPQKPSSGGRNVKRAGGIGGGLAAILLAVFLGSGIFGGNSGTTQTATNSGSTNVSLPTAQSTLLTPASNSWGSGSNLAKLDTSVASGARAKYTNIIGNGQDTVTMMVYMCGTDLESKYGMATKDLAEMAAATGSDKANIIVFTGGCKQWKTSAISASANQIFRVKNGGIETLVSNAGTAAMTDPNNLLSFIQWCKQNYPANRNMLIFWDHGGGSLQGYGYDEKNARSGSMSLAQIDQALKAADMKFDFIGYDACLMATVENALMLSKYADYMIASEETEPGVGWYYTNWVNKLCQNTSISTLELGKQIVDDFVDVCAQQCRGQQTTLSVVDLAELGSTLGDAFTAFSQDTQKLITSDGYQTVSRARSNTREFAGSSSIDQIDLVHFAKNLGTDEAKTLSDVLLSSVKYNRAANITNAYGLSIYFPYKKTSGVDTAVATYDRIGLDSAYSDCIREFANLEVSGQVAAGGTGSALPSLLGQLMSGAAGGSSAPAGASAQDVAQLLNLFLGGRGVDVSGINSGNTGFMFGRSLSTEDAAEYIAANRFDPSNLVWTADHKIALSQDQWDLVQGLDLNMFYDDGTGYVDLGLDNVFDFDDDGNLIGDTDGTWVSINGQPVAYYHLSTAEEGDTYTITGYVPVLLNGERMDLILIFSDEDPYGSIAGARPAYTEDETETVARGLVDLNVGDTIDFLCDYYSYDGAYLDTYKLGEQMTVTENMQISNTSLGGSCLALYRFTDLYNQYYWTLPVPNA